MAEGGQPQQTTLVKKTRLESDTRRRNRQEGGCIALHQGGRGLTFLKGSEPARTLEEDLIKLKSGRRTRRFAQQQQTQQHASTAASTAPATAKQHEHLDGD